MFSKLWQYYHIDANKTHGEKDRRKLHKNATCCFEQILEATSYKTVAITKTIPERQIRHVGHCWRSKNELINKVLLWTPIYGHTNVDHLVRTYLN